MTPTIMAALPTLWSRTEGFNVARAPILELVTSIVQSLEAKSVSMHTVLLPLITTSISGSNMLYLGDPALVLWDAVVRAMAPLLVLSFFFVPVARLTSRGLATPFIDGVRSHIYSRAACHVPAAAPHDER